MAKDIILFRTFKSGGKMVTQTMPMNRDQWESPNDKQKDSVRNARKNGWRPLEEGQEVTVKVKGNELILKGKYKKKENAPKPEAVLSEK